MTIEQASEHLEAFIDSVTEVIGQGGYDDEAKRLLLRASVQVLLLQTLYGVMSPEDTEWLRSVYTTMGGISDE
jgi:hypothetical protein